MSYEQEKIKPYGEEGAKGVQVERMFDSIAHSYDLLNHTLSFGIDKYWRRAAIDSLRPFAPRRILDVATGTGDFALLAARELKPDELLGIDISEGMLDVGRKKVREAGLDATIRFAKEDCLRLSLPDASFDAVMVAYGIRNFENLDRGLQEMCRVLRPGGRLVIIELTAPARFPMKQLFRFYSHVLMPALGRVISRDGRAYTYLPATMEAFPQGEVMQEVLRKAGFADVRFRRFTFGLSTLYTATKAPQPQAGPARLFGLVGYPLGHSFSAKFFAGKFAEEGIDAEYRNFEIPSAGTLPDIIRQHPALCGLNVTIPHKQAVVPLLDELSEEARAIGAVNVIKIERQPGGAIRLKGYNSDVVGFSRSISPLLKPRHRKALVLGTGGASKAVVYGLERLGIETRYVSRTSHPDVLTYGELSPEVMAEYTVIVNCSPVGTYPHSDECPAIPYGLLTPKHLLYDLVYNPSKTLFLRRGAEQGAAVKNGLEMLHLQALAAWEIWNGKE